MSLLSGKVNGPCWRPCRSPGLPEPVCRYNAGPEHCVPSVPSMGVVLLLLQVLRQGALPGGGS